MHLFQSSCVPRYSLIKWIFKIEFSNIVKVEKVSEQYFIPFTRYHEKTSNCGYTVETGSKKKFRISSLFDIFVRATKMCDFCYFSFNNSLKFRAAKILIARNYHSGKLTNILLHEVVHVKKLFSEEI